MRPIRPGAQHTLSGLSGLVLLGALAGCSPAGPAPPGSSLAGPSLAGSSLAGPEAVHDVAAGTSPGWQGWQAAATFAVADPGPLRGRLVGADLLVLGARSLPETLRAAVKRTDGVRAAMPLSVASVAIEGRSLTVGAVDPSSYRRFTPENTARMNAVWERVAAGDVALAPQIGEGLGQPLGGNISFGNTEDAPPVRVGAFASMAPGIDAVVNDLRGRQLGMRADNAILVSTGASDAAVVAGEIESVAGSRVDVTPLSAPAGTAPAAYLTGGSVAAAVGSFGYRYFPDGSIEPDAAWVAANIRTQSVPILGSVTGHRVLLPQLYGALAEVERAGLAELVNPQDFGGAYVPRFIDRDPTRGISLHTWGIAVDLNVATNQLGTAGQMDPRIVDIFARWGFAWGGTWQRPDPMHFELASLVRSR